MFILSIKIACSVAAFSEVEGDAIGADGWRPGKTIARVISLLGAALPPETAAGAVCAATPFSIFRLELCVAAGAVLCVFPICRCADVPTLPIELPPLPLASVHALGVVREEEEEGEEQSALS